MKHFFFKLQHPADDSSSAGAPPTKEHAVKTAEQLLYITGNRKVIAITRRLSGLPDHVFDEMVLPALYHFLEQVQLMPLSPKDGLRRPGSMLESALNKLGLALRKRQNYLLPPGADAEDIKRHEALWTYGVIAAVLLHYLALALSDRQVVLLLADDTRQDWELPGTPIEESGAKHYLVLERAAAQRLDAATLLKLLPAAGRDWLAGDAALMAALEGICRGDESAAGILHEIAIESELPPSGPSEAPPASAENAPQLGDLIEILPGMSPEASGFLQWLSDSLKNGTLPYNCNGATVHFVDDGEMLLISPRIFQEYAGSLQEHDEHAWRRYQKGLIRTQLCRETTPRRYLHRFKIKGYHKRLIFLTGLVLERRYAEYLLYPIPADNTTLQNLSLNSD